MKPVALPADAEVHLYHGVAESAVSAVSAGLIAEDATGVVVLVGAAGRALEAWSEDLEFFLHRADPKHPVKMITLPNLGELEPDDPRAFELNCYRLAALSALTQARTSGGERICLSIHPAALLQPLPAPKQIQASGIQLKVGQETDFQALMDRLNAELHYDAEALCETPGQFAVRGGLIDIYPLNATAPLRIDFFGNEIDSIREFDPTTQRSGESLKEAFISPAIEPGPLTDKATLLDYLPEHVTWIFREPERLALSDPELFQFPENLPPPSRNLQHLVTARAKHGDRWLALASLDLDSPLLGTGAKRIAVESESLENYATFGEANQMGVVRKESEERSRRDLLQQLLRWQKAGHRVTFALKTEAEERRLRELIEADDAGRRLEATVEITPMSEGFRLSHGSRREVWVTEAELFGRRRIRVGRRQHKMPHRQAVDQALDFSELADGDYLVHLQNGVCIYRGMQKLKVGKREEEVISLEFDEGVTVHLRLHESHLLSR
ncbi:MAG: CarD family transcriptional regulator, partial [Puniceicoccales bacterium]